MTVSRPPPTAIDEVIPSQDQLLLQFAFSDLFEASGGTIIGSLLKVLSVSFSPSIKSKPLRHATLAFAAAVVPYHLSSSFAERVEEHSDLASKALRKKTSIDLDEGDLFAVCLLTMLSCMYRDTEKFRIHIGGVMAIMTELQNKSANTGTSNSLATFWPLARDVILHGYRAVPRSNRLALKFCNVSQQIIGPQNFRDRTIYFSRLFGVASDRLRFYTYEDCIWQYSHLLRRCFRDTVYRQTEGKLKVSSVVASVISEVKVDFLSPAVTRIFDEVSEERVSLSGQEFWGEPMIFTLLLHHFCQLLLIYLEADSVLESTSSPEARMAANSLVHCVRSEWHVFEDPARPLPARYQTIQSLLPRMLCMAGLTLTKEKCPEGILHPQLTQATAEIGSFTVSEWIVYEIEQAGEPHIARGLEIFWGRGGVEDIRELLHIICSNSRPFRYDFW